MSQRRKLWCQTCEHCTPHELEDKLVMSIIYISAALAFSVGVLGCLTMGIAWLLYLILPVVLLPLWLLPLFSPKETRGQWRCLKCRTETQLTKEELARNEACNEETQEAVVWQENS